MNGQRVYDFLNWGNMDHTEETMFSGVHQLRGGEYIELSLQTDLPLNLKPKTWYTLIPQPFKGSFLDATEGYRELLQDAVRLRLRADVEVGSCLSGGLDSSTLVCLSNELLKEQNATQKQNIFSACSTIPSYDERPHIETVVAATGVKAHYTYPSMQNLFDELPDIIWHQDEPFGSTSIYAQWTVFKLVKEANVKVMLDGQGADEQLAGYHGFFGNRLYDLFLTMRWKKLLQEMQTIKGLHPMVKPETMLLNKLIPDFIRQPLRKLLNKTAKNSDWIDCHRLGAHSRDPFVRQPNKTVFQQSKLQMLHSNLPMLLHYEDRDSMAQSVESRTPFLDYRLVEYTLGLPSHYKLENGVTKRILREGMKGLLPESIRNRMDKMGFVTPEEEWVRKQAPEQFKKAIHETLELSQGILRPAIKEMTEQMIQGNKPFSNELWRFVCFGQWIKRFSVSK